MARTAKQDSPREEAAASPPAAPSFFRVLFNPPSDVLAPIEAAGKWWHHGTYHVLAEAAARELENLPHFSLLGPAEPPPTKQP